MAVIALTVENFDEVIANNSTVLVDFWAEWCGPCRMLSPTVEEIADEVTDIVVGKVNVDDESDLAEKYGIMSIPTLMVFKDGTLTQTSLGVKSKAAILEML
jgi:thioredoxin